MKWVLLCTHFFVLVACVPLVYAASTLTDITPDNVAEQPLGLRVATEAQDDGTVRFDVFVTSGRDAVSPRRDGRLEIAREDIVKKDPGKNLPLQRPVIWCSVRELSEDGTLHFTFGLPLDTLARATFQFRNYEPRGMPSMDVYRLLLKEFAPTH